MQSGFIS